MKIAYFGKKRPKKVAVPISENPVTGDMDTKEYVFEPFQETEVPDNVGSLLLTNAPDIFKRTDSIEARRPVADPIIKTEGYVGEEHAAEIKDLEKRIEQETREEEGKDIEQVIEEEKEKTKRGRKTAAKKEK